jgi:hypothetical protein
MSTVSQEIWHCDICGFEWVKNPEIIPEQCPSRKCRSRKWNINGGKINGEYGAKEKAPVARRDEAGDSQGRVESGNKGGNKAGTGNTARSRSEFGGASVGSKTTVGRENKVGEVIAPFRGSGKCPHEYVNWMVCPDCNPKVAK